MTIVHEKIHFDGDSLELCLSSKPGLEVSVRYKDRTYVRPDLLTRDYPSLLNRDIKENVISISKILNHLSGKGGYTIIDDPDQFKDRYKKQILESSSLISHASYPPCDSSLIKEPCWSEPTTLTFYTQNVATGVLFKTSFLFSKRINSNYTPLPFVNY